MIAVDTNVLARFYCDDPSDPQAQRQRPAARRLMADSAALYVPLSVVLELEWVMRGFYELAPADFCSCVEHLLGLPHVTVERWELVKDAAELHRAGLDFADALHWVAARAAGCAELRTFDRRLTRAGARRALEPAITAP